MDRSKAESVSSTAVHTEPIDFVTHDYFTKYNGRDSSPIRDLSAATSLLSVVQLSWEIISPLSFLAFPAVIRIDK